MRYKAHTNLWEVRPVIQCLWMPIGIGTRCSVYNAHADAYGIGTRYKAPHYNHFNSNDFIECPSS